VVITAGRWLIVFIEPLAAFLRPGLPSVADIYCFVSIEDIIERHEAVFRLLHRHRLADTLSLTMPVAEALAILAPPTISQVLGDAASTAVEALVHPEVSATVAGEAGFIRRKRRRSDDGSAT